MKMEDMILVSVDDHILAAPDMFDGISADLKPHAPKFVTEDEQNDYWLFMGREIRGFGLSSVVGRPPEEWGHEMTSLNQVRKGSYDIDARIEDMNVNGVLAGLNFPAWGNFSQVEDKAIALGLCRHHNDWLINDWAKKYPGRFIINCPIPTWDVEAAVAEVRRVAKMGAHSINFSDNPAANGLPPTHNPYWDPLWKVVCDEGLVVNMHFGNGTQMHFASPETAIDAAITTMPLQTSHTMSDLVFSRLFLEFPDLKVSFAEGAAGWVAWLMDRMDFVYDHHHQWTRQDFGGKLPSQILREHAIFCFIDDPVAIAMRHKIGIETLTYEVDYPHSDSTWPNSPEILWESLKDIPDEDINQITHGNAMEQFGLKSFDHIAREDCTVGALRAQAADVDVTYIKTRGAGRPPATHGGIITGKDIAAQVGGVKQTDET